MEVQQDWFHCIEISLEEFLLKTCNYISYFSYKLKLSHIVKQPFLQSQHKNFTNYIVVLNKFGLIKII